MNERIELDTISFSYSVGARVADEYSVGTVKDRRWWIDTRNAYPAVPAYLVRFDDRREKVVAEDELRAV